MTTEKKKERILGVDFGERRAGLALGVGGVTAPLGVFKIRGGGVETLISEIVRICLEEKVEKIVLGLPLNARGEPTPQSLKVREFGKRLARRVGRPVIFWDEFQSSKEALQEAIALDVSQKRRRTLDDIAAMVMLRRYLADSGGP